MLLQDLALTRAPAWWVCFTHPGNPQRKARPRAFLTKSKKIAMYSPKDTADAELELAKRMRYELARRNVRVPLEGPLALVTGFYRDSAQSVDVDNLQKLVMDAATRGGVWYDDRQVTASAQWISLDRENPRTLIAIAPHDSPLRSKAKRR